MSELDIVRAMKDEEYRTSLTADLRARLPETPVGVVQLSDEELNAVAAGYTKWTAPASTCTNWFNLDCCSL